MVTSNRELLATMANYFATIELCWLVSSMLGNNALLSTDFHGNFPAIVECWQTIETSSQQFSIVDLFSPILRCKRRLLGKRGEPQTTMVRIRLSF